MNYTGEKGNETESTDMSFLIEKSRVYKFMLLFDSLVSKCSATKNNLDLYILFHLFHKHIIDQDLQKNGLPGSVL